MSIVLDRHDCRIRSRLTSDIQRHSCKRMAQDELNKYVCRTYEL